MKQNTTTIKRLTKRGNRTEIYSIGNDLIFSHNIKHVIVDVYYNEKKDITVIKYK